MFRVALLALALAGCVTANTAMLDDRTAVISGRGTAFDRTSGVLRAVLVKAATEAQSRGFPYFAIVGSRDASSVGSFTSPTTTNVNAYGTSNCSGYYCSGAVNGTATTYGGQTSTFIRPGADVMVRFLAAAEVTPETKDVWSVASVLAANPKKNNCPGLSDLA